MTLHPPIEQKRTINVFVLSMLSMAVVISLRNLPLTAEYGLSSLFFYLMATLFFMVPYALVAAELASGWPKAGGVYVWVLDALGERWGFFAIWMQWFHNVTWYPTMLAFVGAGFAYVFNPELLLHRSYLIAVVIGGFWAITLFNFLGIKASSWTSALCVIIGVIIPGALLISLGGLWILRDAPIAIDLSPKAFLPDLSQWSNITFLSGIFLALSGLEVNANLAREVKHPQKNYPRAIFLAATLTVLILVLGSIAIAFVIPRAEISLVTGLFDAFHSFFRMYNLSWIVPIVAIFAVLGALGELNAWAIAGVKGLFVTTEHGSLPPILHKVNKRSVPVNLLLFQAIIVTLATFIILYLPNINIAYWALSALSSQMYLFMYILLLISGVVLRYRKPHVERPYRLPGKNVGIWICALLGITASLFAIGVSFVPPEPFITGGILKYELLLACGIAISIAIPLVIYACRKAHWKSEVYAEMRKEISKKD